MEKNRSSSIGNPSSLWRIYVDVDFECVNTSVFEELNQSFDLYIGFEPVEHGLVNGFYKTCNAIIGAIPYHPLIRNLIVNLRNNWHSNKCKTAVQKSGPDFFSNFYFILRTAGIR